MRIEDPRKYRLHVCSWAMVKEWRALNSRTTDLWNLLGKAFQRAIDSPCSRYLLHFTADPTKDPMEGASNRSTPGAPEFIIRMPSGRDLTYHKISNTKDKGLKCKTNLYKKGKDKYTFTFGGKLTENLVQALSRDVFAWQLEQLYYEGIPALFTAHDEGIFEVRDSEVTEKKARIDHWMTTAPPWMPGLVLGNDSGVFDKYCKG